jgi:ATP-dependent Lhr-like helicase
LAAHGWASADSFEGLRALLVPSEKRTPLGQPERKGRHKTITSLEFAGRWTLLRKIAPITAVNGEAHSRASDESVEAFARALLRRYGVVFRRMLEREALSVSWYELGRIYRRLEARGEIRGGHFVNGVSGEQFALPGAIGLLRSLRKAAPKGELNVISAADPLNLLGILTPGPRIAAIAANRILFQDGLPVAALDGGKIVQLDRQLDLSEREIRQTLIVVKLAPSLRPYYA